MVQEQLNRLRMRRRWIDFISLCALLAFVLLAALVKHKRIDDWDHAISRYIQSFEQPWITDIAVWLSFIGSRDAIIVLCLITVALQYMLLKHRTEIFLLIGVIIGSSILNLLLKLAFQRMRPDIHRLIEVTGYSFPSGHSMVAFSFYGVLAYLLWRHIEAGRGRIVLVVFAVLMIGSIGLSRVYLGVHYPSDIVGGYLAACFWLAMSVGRYERFTDRSRRKAAGIIRGSS
ncbi:phospholipid phosphatase [Paenibacillus ihbetae]|uniref:Phospholipid phosphatase n=1 Tax=Paenibacillus ihbetae TaxID=1870820 RepID=A0A1B2E604_9BACL|nr:phosphatase PAP2 family protein [Paenibacillus ihbetae]ANY75406.1 phospholipid phosphatase [Paenibacillus ihbetae]